MGILRDFEKLLDKVNQDIEKNKRNAHYKQIGYSTRCKTCNHPLLEDIERLYNNGYSYESIIKELDLEDISIMALSRHFTNHYPVSQEYKAKQRKMALERLVYILKDYPFLEQFFDKQDDEFIREFTKDNGFCIDAMKLCPYIRAGMVSNCQHICNGYWRFLDNTMARTYSRDKTVVLQTHYHETILKCLQCKDNANEERLNLMELFICNNMLNVEVVNKELYAHWITSSIDKQQFAQILQHAREDLWDNSNKAIE